MQFKNKLCKMKANLKYKLAESFCRNFVYNQEILLKQYLQSALSQKKWIPVDEKIHSAFFVKQKKWKCSNLSRQKSWIAVKLWDDWSQVIASFLEIKTFSSHPLMDCAVKQCIQHAYWGKIMPSPPPHV